ncbi:MAG: FliO/MopB family protein [Marmoricola sp.]
MLELTIRLVVSLTIVVGLLLVLARVGARRFRGSSGALVQVVHRQPLSRTSSVAVVSVGTRVLVLGTTEQHISVLAELEPDEIDLDLQDATVLELAGSGQVLELPDTEMFIEPVEAPRAAPVAPVSRVTPARRTAGAHRAAPAPKQPAVPNDGALAGSVLSPQTWRQALAAVRRAS